MTAWVEIVRKALNTIVDASGKAASGAKLRSEVAKVAAEWSIAFPPEEMTRFSSFVESFDRDFIVLRRPGSDILVAPADRAELFANSAFESSANHSRMRQDIFEAITSLAPSDRGTPYYIPASDSVVWVKVGEVPSKDAIALPGTTLLGEVELRKAFHSQIENPELAAAEFTRALASNAPLRQFTDVAQAHGLNKQWHFFRLRALSAKLREWSVRNGIAWHVEWVNSMEPKTVAVTTTVGAGEARALLGELLSKVSDEDLARIAVPLDVVLRILSQR